VEWTAYPHSTTERGSGNVFADLGFEDAEEMLAKAKLVQAIANAMEATDVTQSQMAQMIGMDQSKESKLLRGITDESSSDRLLRIPRLSTRVPELFRIISQSWIKR